MTSNILCIQPLCCDYFYTILSFKNSYWPMSVVIICSVSHFFTEKRCTNIIQLWHPLEQVHGTLECHSTQVGNTLLRYSIQILGHFIAKLMHGSHRIYALPGLHCSFCSGDYTSVVQQWQISERQNLACGRSSRCQITFGKNMYFCWVWAICSKMTLVFVGILHPNLFL